MPEQFALDACLDCGAKDRDVVRGIADRLKKDGVRVSLDEREPSHTLVMFVSANTTAEEWARMEERSRGSRDPLENERRFVLVRLGEVAIKSSLAHFVPLSWVGDGAYEKLLEKCRIAAPVVSSTATVKKQKAEHEAQLESGPSSFATVISPDQTRALSGSGSNVLLWNIEDGRRLRELKGHSGGVYGVAWTRDGRLALSSDSAGSVRLWDVQKAEFLRQFEGHTGWVWGLAFNDDGRLAVSSGQDSIIRLWDVASGKCLRTFSGHTAGVNCVAWSVDQRQLVSGSVNSQVRIWDVESGSCLKVLEGHTKEVLSVGWGADGRRVVSGGTDKAVRIWDAATGRCLRVLEGHTDSVWTVASSRDGQFALSGGADYAVRLWNQDTGQCLATFSGNKSTVKSVSWSADDRKALAVDSNGRVRIWNLAKIIASTLQPKAAAAPDQIQYANAKVLLVGDTGVGKTGLAERLVHQRFNPTKSSHARKAHLLESKVVEQAGGVPLNQETVLWDLAGQPAYRLVHQLSMEDAALACVLFDCRNETNPFEGAAYWSQVLDQARTSSKLKKLLVASRIDVGGLPAGRDRIETFAKDNEFREFIPTSASTGEGCDVLLEAIRRETPWDELPKVTTTRTLAALREYLAKLKKSAPKLLSIAALHEGFASDFGDKIPLDEFIAHLERLEASDDVELLVFKTTGATPRPEHLVLLDPTRVDAYASALLVAAKDEPDGPGHLLESRVRAGEFKLDQDERIADRESEQHVLWFVMENLLYRDLALRERIKNEDYIVFPSQCTAELRFPGVAAFGVAFGFAGPVRSIYATLIAQLAHYEGFRKREFFQDAAAYRPEDGGRCLVRFRDHGHGTGELEVLFDRETPVSVRQGFLEFVAKHLEAKSKPGSVTRRHAYHCANASCGEAFDDRVVRANLTSRRKDLLCPFCRKKTRLEDLLAAPSAAAESVAAQISTDATAGRQRMTAGLVIKAKEAEGKFDVFLSHNSKDKSAVEKIAKRLLSVGLRPWLDKWSLPAGATLSTALEEAIKTIHCAALCFGPADVGRWHIMEIRAYVERWASGDARMIPVVLPGVPQIPELPIFVRQTLWADMREWEKPGSDGFYQLVCGILGKPPGDSPMKKFGVREVVEWQGTSA